MDIRAIWHIRRTVLATALLLVFVLSSEQAVAAPLLDIVLSSEQAVAAPLLDIVLSSEQAIAAPLLDIVLSSEQAIAAPLSGLSTRLKPAATFEPAECMFDPLIPGLSDPTIECGYLTVPEQRYAENGEQNGGDGAGASERTIRLAVAILRSSSDTPEPDPLFVAQGGPGGSTIDTYALLLGSHPIRTERDIVLFDQRGTLYSEPNLLCTEAFDAMVDLLALPEEEATEQAEQLMQACRQRLVDEGVNLAAYNSFENAADVEDLRLALGYDDINFYGVSYGTLLGLHLLRDFPDQIRSMILDGVVPAQTNFLTQIAQSQERAFSEFFAACAADSDCRERYPDLEDRFFALVDRLNETPIPITLTDPETGQRVNSLLYGDDVVDFLFQMFYVSGSVGMLPAAIADLERDDVSYIETMYSLFLFDRTMSEGMYSSVICAEEAGYDVDAIDVDGVRPRFVETIGEELAEMLDGCAIWDVPVLPDLANQPVESDVPTLLLSGRFDPITPPGFAETAAETLPNSFNYVLPTGGHGVAFLVDDCMDEIVIDFLGDPDTEPSSSCIDRVAPLEFLGDNTMTVPLLGFLNGLSRNAWLHVGIAGLLLMGVLSALVVWPLAWFVRTLRGVSPQRSEQERKWRLIGRMLALVYGGLAMLFVLGIVLVVGFVVVPDQNMLLLSAVPRSVTPLFLMPYLLALLSLAMLLLALRYWRRGEGSVWGRIYYSFLAACTMAYVAILYLDGLFGVVF